MEKQEHRPLIETLACPYKDCYLYAKSGRGNLSVRKVYGKDRIRYLRCRSCAREFSERRNKALFNSKIEEKKAISVAEHLSERGPRAKHQPVAAADAPRWSAGSYR
jgi:hypothetical protein